MSKFHPDIQRREPFTAERLRELLHYDPETGVFTWLVDWPNGIRVGDVAGYWKDGRHIIKVSGHTYYAYRLAWLYQTGEWPSDEIDHRDLDVSNDRWDNLRLATSMQNMQNASLRRNNTSGFKGVTFHKGVGKFRSMMRINGRRYHLGYYKTAEEAHQAYSVFALKFHGEFARTE